MVEWLDEHVVDFDYMREACTEVVANAVKHGNKEDSEKLFRLELEISNDRLTIQVDDEGQPFEIGDVPDPRAKENLLKCSGRGLLYIRSLAGFSIRCEPMENGKSIILEKKLDKN